MSRNFFPVVLAIGMGVATGYYSFQPALKELQNEKGTIQGSGQSPPAVQQQQQPQDQDQKLVPATTTSTAASGPSS
ncbi:hypothetical protein BDW59DRAFT_161858 [Aspergillus cavernicola]|uniref:Uncharacterized protein n=1 Tax=Aspergillus cavernicola TaxID=176166 RepID=A0ABR4IBL6_9EURO